MDGIDGEDGLAGPDGAPGENFPFPGPLFMFPNGKQSAATDSHSETHCQQVCPPGPPGLVGMRGEIVKKIGKKSLKN